ncbi:hypothetical protein ASPZODRAFT_2129488 [Penicilliopsis zonata CBS 506.65]|uniref:Uncharacterized protein n=1 Tax=Penicilliopsis zonata CBS 506.65 TaxID=1073090 RepID=A0A1L9SGZ8_9EURO|nr:hypothetical protein ASPZODRAFT_2129488 [Penicilliopsis zonata CBS 506.65]OJJ46469.1 hypothetical protein ASPZODRAFT_2129488 [Penicilliopsis zonata CBS 506.65]
MERQLSGHSLKKAQGQPRSFLSTLEPPIFHDKTDIIYNHRERAQRRRIEWPTVDDTVQAIVRAGDDTPKTPLPATAQAVVDREIALCDTRRGLIRDLGVYDQVYLRAPKWRGVLRNLYWRARRQSAVWDVFCLLVDRGFVHPQCLVVPVDLQSDSQDTHLVILLLCRFSYIRQDEDAFLQNKIPCQTGSWYDDIEWLATMIVRSGVDLERLFDTIQACGFLGDCSPEELQEFKQEYPDARITHNPRDREAQPGLDPASEHVFGFWLPHGLASDDEDLFGQQLAGCLGRFNDIEKAFRDTEDISPDQLWLEREQIEFFGQREDLLPGSKNDQPQGDVLIDDAVQSGQRLSA